MYNLQNHNKKFTSLELVKQINFFRGEFQNKSELAHNDLLKIIRDEFEEEISLGKISQSKYTNSRGREYPMYILTTSQAKQVLIRESKKVRRAVIKYIEELEGNLTSQQKRLYYKKVPVMTVDMLAKELNISTVTVNKMLYKLDDGNVLTGNELKYFKKENSYKSSCSLLRIIYHRVADTIARNLGKQLSDYFLFDCDKYKLPLEQMQIALKQADNLARIGKQISNKEDKDFVLMKASEILVNIGLWDNKEDTDYDINSLDGWNKKCKIGNNLGYINRQLKLL
ncbi:hypothetical protein HMPREF1983_00908 [Gemella bergeri ATCC 700627]|uniref:Uncharacterized protein n=1 Tax=Gemella bergeri ATCC 700627 TaxID=1321820 RepID=U2S5G0_9BACL|nr:hypothetical protein [Gemella bergeri]ERK58002.1 hypothetical protein HMPREF1983_00908 [Gemella bergeri ATCC 700627]